MLSTVDFYAIRACVHVGEGRVPCLPYVSFEPLNTINDGLASFFRVTLGPTGGMPPPKFPQYEHVT